MIDTALLNVTCPNYTEPQLQTIANGFCPHCEQPTVYRILETYHSAEHGMLVNRVKCPNITRCDWDEMIPNRRSDNGLDNFFHS